MTPPAVPPRKYTFQKGDGGRVGRGLAGACGGAADGGAAGAAGAGAVVAAAAAAAEVASVGAVAAISVGISFTTYSCALVPEYVHVDVLEYNRANCLQIAEEIHAPGRAAHGTGEGGNRTWV